MGGKETLEGKEGRTQGEERKKEDIRTGGGEEMEEGEDELSAVSLQESNTSKDSEFIWRTRTQRGNSVNTSSSKTLDSSTSPTGTR